jgi:ketosteroid isomerase-like protein
VDTPGADEAVAVCRDWEGKNLVELWQPAFETGRFQDVPGFGPLMHPDFKLEPSHHAPVGLERSMGPEAALAFFREWFEIWDEYRASFDRFEERDGNMIYECEVTTTGAASGASMKATGYHVLGFKDGKIARWRLFPDRDSALAAL